MEKVLIIQMCRMGDLVQTLPLLKRLKEEKPDCEITLFCVRESVDLVRHSPLVDRFVAIPQQFYDQTREEIERDPARVTSLWDFPALHSHYDLVINLTHDLSSAILCERVPADKKSGRIHALNNEIRTLGDWSKYLFASVHNRRQNFFNLVDIHVGMGGIPHKPVEEWLVVDHRALERGKSILKAQGYQENGPLIALQMGASQLHRAWPTRNFAALAHHLRQHSGVEIVLLGSSREMELGAEFLRYVHFPVINLIGQTQVNDLPAIIKSCDFLVSNDTGTAHIAAAVGTKVLGLYFATAYWGETAPYGPNNLVLQVEIPCAPCLQSQKCEAVDCKDYLTVEAVQDAASMMLLGRVDKAFDHPNLSLLVSRFLSNGTLAYIPVSATISESYQTGFINRILWEEALRLGQDQDYIYRCLSQMRDLNTFREQVAACYEQYTCLRDQCDFALRLAQNIIFECYRQPFSEQRIVALNSQILSVINKLSRLKESLLMHYYMYTMMDTDYSPHPQMAHQMVRTYSKLSRISRHSAHLLEELGSLSQGETMSMPAIFG